MHILPLSQFYAPSLIEFCTCIAYKQACALNACTYWNHNTHDAAHASSLPCRKNCAAVATETECFLLLYFIHILRLADKNTARYHSYFIGNSQNELSARLCQCICMCALCERMFGFFLVVVYYYEWTFFFVPFLFPHFVFLLRSFCQHHMTAIWPRWWLMNHSKCASAFNCRTTVVH